jgi:predicted nucleic acid-binding protein
VIHLDTSFLIPALVPGSPEDRRLRRWLGQHEPIRVSALVWAEFLCGPVTTIVVEDAAELLGEPVSFDGIDSTVAAQLFNTGGRKLGSLVDCMIAAVAMGAGARLATSNPADFRKFAALGLSLA